MSEQPSQGAREIIKKIYAESLWSDDAIALVAQMEQAAFQRGKEEAESKHCACEFTSDGKLISECLQHLDMRSTDRKRGKEEALAKYQRGEFTAEEVQSFCHHLNEKPGCTLADFKTGCREYQRKLYGESSVNAFEETLHQMMREKWKEEGRREEHQRCYAIVEKYRKQYLAYDFHSVLLQCRDEILTTDEILATDPPAQPAATEPEPQIEDRLAELEFKVAQMCTYERDFMNLREGWYESVSQIISALEQRVKRLEEKE